MIGTNKDIANYYNNYTNQQVKFRATTLAAKIVSAGIRQVNYPNNGAEFIRSSTVGLFDETVISDDDEDLPKNYIALFLLIIPVLTIFGNALVVISVVREKSLHTHTNFLIASLAISDFLVAFCVMPFAVYVVVENSLWNLPKLICNIYIAADVCASTASILNLAAVSWDRYMAVSKPIQYAQNSKNNARVKGMIFLVWFISVAIALPVMTGLNDLEDTQHCEFTNAAYIVASSVGSFYVPCVIMVVLYTVVLKNLRKRQRQKLRNAFPFMAKINNNNGCNSTVLIENDYFASNVLLDSNLKLNLAQNSNRLLNPKKCATLPALPTLSTSSLYLDTQVPHSAPSSSSVAFDYDTEYLPYIDANSESEELQMTSVETGRRNKQQDKQMSRRLCIVKHALLLDVCWLCCLLPLTCIHHTESAQKTLTVVNPTFSFVAKENSNFVNESPRIILNGVTMSRKRAISNAINSNILKRRNKIRESKFRKETKATQTLAIVLGVFLLCWLPFFVCHLTNSVCMLRFGNMCIPIMAFFLTTWLGYMNSFMNPLIYTVFNPEYRKAFSNILIRKRSQGVL